MDQGLQKYLFNKLYTGHKHQEVTAWLMCPTCGPKYRAWKTEKERIKREKPELFIDQAKVDKNKKLDALITDITDVNQEFRRIKNLR